MSDERLSQLASEPPSASARRAQLAREVEALQEGLDKCRRWRPRGELEKQQSTEDANIRTIASSPWPATHSSVKLPDLSNLTITGQPTLVKTLPAPAKPSAQYTGGDFAKSVFDNLGSSGNKTPSTSSTSSHFSNPGSTDKTAASASGVGSNFFSSLGSGSNNTPSAAGAGGGLFGSAGTGTAKVPSPFGAGTGLLGATTSQAGKDSVSTSAFGFGSARAAGNGSGLFGESSRKT